jgi:hypothetical protein
MHLLSRRIPLAILAAGAAAALPAGASAQQEARCREAHRFMVEQAGMTAVSEPDTIDDWRTQEMIPGCRITAAGVTTSTMKATAERFYELVRDAGWTRTPDPRDAPNEASLRFRRDGTDCLFSFYTDGLLGTEAEGIVDDAVVPGPGEERYNFLVMCTPALPAAPR